MNRNMLPVLFVALATTAAGASEAHICDHSRLPMPTFGKVSRQKTTTRLKAAGAGVVFELSFVGDLPEHHEEIRAVLEAAAAKWSSLLDSNATIEIEVEYWGEYAMGYGVLAMAGPNGYYQQEDADSDQPWTPGTVGEILGWEDPNGDSADGLLIINRDEDFSAHVDGIERIEENKVDLYTVLLHEIGHLVGFNGFDQYGFMTTIAGTSRGDSSTFDVHVTWDSLTGGFYFDEEFAPATAQFWPSADFGPVWLTRYVGTHHIDESIPSLMNPYIDANVRTEIGMLELAMLADSGTPVNIQCWGDDAGDADSDGDGTPDCTDLCPDDPAKTGPGWCGCDEPETDGDGDGVPDCTDLCPDDPAKTEPGDCGCNELETDGDGDGVPDCSDLCPYDRNKIEPGDCGCGELETDRDRDEVPDCADLCPDEPAMVEPGECGCEPCWWQQTDSPDPPDGSRSEDDDIHIRISVPMCGAGIMMPMLLTATLFFTGRRWL